MTVGDLMEELSQLAIRPETMKDAVNLARQLNHAISDEVQTGVVIQALAILLSAFMQEGVREIGND